VIDKFDKEVEDLFLPTRQSHVRTPA
jgi:hypothetical protein